jgi:hypothetical protein
MTASIISKTVRCAAICVVITLCGCGPLLKVSVLDKTKPQGLPFFVKAGACVQQTVYGTPYRRITLKVTYESGETSSDAVTIGMTPPADGALQIVLDQLASDIPDESTVARAWSNLKLAKIDPFTDTTTIYVLANGTSATSVVDYNSAYAINQNKPLSGTASVDFHLATDGTLSEAQGQVQDTTFSTIVSALPISTLITSAAGISSKAGPAANEPKLKAKFQLTQEQRFVKRTLSKVSSFAPNCPVAPPLAPTDQTASMTLTDSGAADSANASPDTSASTDSISINGTIKLPKSLIGQANPADAANKQGAAQNPAKPGQNQPAAAKGKDK